MLAGPHHPMAVKLRRQHEMLVAALLETRIGLRAYGIQPGNFSVTAINPAIKDEDYVSSTPMVPPEHVSRPEQVPHPTLVKAKARRASLKDRINNRPSRERVIAAITRALSGSASSLGSKAIHRFVLAELQVTDDDVSMMTVAKYLGKNPHLFDVQIPSQPNRHRRWLLAPKFNIDNPPPDPYPMR